MGVSQKVRHMRRFKLPMESGKEAMLEFDKNPTKHSLYRLEVKISAALLTMMKISTALLIIVRKINSTLNQMIILFHLINSTPTTSTGEDRWYNYVRIKLAEQPNIFMSTK